MSTTNEQPHAGATNSEYLNNQPTYALLTKRMFTDTRKAINRFRICWPRPQTY